MGKNKKKIVIVMGVVCIAFIGIFTYKHINKAPSNTIEQLEILNVEENESIKANKEAIISDGKFAHISLDDFITAFEDITNNMDKYTSIFENDTFAYLKNLHDNYGAVISCYTYYESDDKKFNLSKCTDKFAEEFEANSEWLKFGFHTLNGSKNYENTSSEEAKEDYDKVVAELLRITGSDKCIDTVVRLQNFSGNEESVQAMIDTNYGIQGVLGADDKRRSYYLNDENNSYLYLYDYYDNNNIDFFRTDLRMELIDNIDETLEDFYTNTEFEEKNEILIAFTHEWKLGEDGIKEKLEKTCEFAVKNGYDFDFPMNRIIKND